VQPVKKLLAHVDIETILEKLRTVAKLLVLCRGVVAACTLVGVQCPLRMLVIYLRRNEHKRLRRNTVT